MSKYDFVPFVFIRDIKNAIKNIFIPHNVQIGTSDAPRELNLTGRLTLTPQKYTFSNDNLGIVALTNDDTLVNVSYNDDFLSSSFEAILICPNQPRHGQIIFIKDIDGYCDLKPITITHNNNNVHQLTINHQSTILSWDQDTLSWTILENYIPQQTWKTILEEDFSNLTTQTFPTNSICKINNKTWIKGGSAFETGSYTKIENNVGLMFYSTTTSSFISATLENCCPYLGISLSNLYDNLNMSTPLRVSMLFPTASGSGSNSNTLTIGCGVVSSLQLTSSTTRTSDVFTISYQNGSKVSYSDFGTRVLTTTTISTFNRNSASNYANVLSSTIGQLTYKNGFIPGDTTLEFYTPVINTDWTLDSTLNNNFLVSLGIQHGVTNTALVFPDVTFTNPNNLYLLLFGYGDMTWAKPPTITKLKIEAFY